MDTHWVEVYVGLGSNLGDRAKYIQSAIAFIAQEKDVRGVEVSSLYETEPVGYTEQPPFLNAVARFLTLKSPEQCLDMIKLVEAYMGRKRSIRWGPRTIDIDLLLYGDVTMDTSDLIVPHPRMAERSFVLIPLMELSNDVNIPGKGKVRYLIDHLKGKEGVRLWSPPPWLTESGHTES